MPVKTSYCSTKRRLYIFVVFHVIVALLMINKGRKQVFFANGIDKENKVEIEPKSKSTTEKEQVRSVIKIDQGKEPNSWKVVDWHSDNVISEEEEAKFNCEFASFQSTTGKEAQMCVHPFTDYVSNSVRLRKRNIECDHLPELWNAATANATKEMKEHPTDKKQIIYVDMGANIGTCVMEMLLSTDANIIAFEPHPMNLYNLKKTVSSLNRSYQDRLILFPIGLGDAHGSSTIHSAKDNMGNSVIGKIIKDYENQTFIEEFTTHVERFDSILDKDMIDLIMLKLDVQGFECQVLDGTGEDLLQTIELITFEWAYKWLRGQNCTDLFPRLKSYGFDIFSDANMSTESKLDEPPLNDVIKDFIASRRKTNER